MAGKVSKRAKKFNKNQLQKTIADRRKHQVKKQQIDAQKQKKASRVKRKREEAVGHPGKSSKQVGKQKAFEDGDDEDEAFDDEELDEDGGLYMTVDDLLNAKGLRDEDDDEDEDADEDEAIEDDLESVGSEDDSAHGMDLEALKAQDPEFYQYLQEHDKDLLDFDPEAAGADDASDVEMAESTAGGKKRKAQKQTVLTKDLLKSWQRAILEKRSLRAMRKLLIAFRGAVFSASDETAASAFTVESSSVFNALVRTTLKYTPAYLSQTVPAKELASGKFKIATNSKPYSAAQRLIRSYFSSMLELVSQLPSRSEDDSKSSKGDSLLYVAISESAKITPWVVGNRKLCRVWTKALLELWATADDRVRIAAYLALRRLAVASDASMTENIMKGLYVNIVRSAKGTSAYTLPSINMMKNSAVEMFLVDQRASYSLVFGYIRQLAIHLRNSMKLKTKEGFQAVYNWQFVHSLDFWSLVLSAACDKSSVAAKGPSPLQPLIYPLVQVTVGLITLIPTSRYYPLRFHCVRLLLRLTQRTGTFIPLASYLIEALESPDLKRNPKPTNFKPLDWEYYLRAPKQYQRTRVYVDGISEEATFLLLDYFATLSKSIAFPELALPVVMTLKRFAKRSKNPKAAGHLRTLVEKLEANRTWIEEKRSQVDFSPADRSKVDEFLASQDPAKTPLGGFLKSQVKAREQRRAAMERAAVDEVRAD